VLEGPGAGTLPVVSAEVSAAVAPVPYGPRTGVSPGMPAVVSAELPAEGSVVAGPGAGVSPAVPEVVSAADDSLEVGVPGVAWRISSGKAGARPVVQDVPSKNRRNSGSSGSGYQPGGVDVDTIALLGPSDGASSRGYSTWSGRR
jgi:hypothetical protein